MRIGVIADDFTGGTDIASFLVKGGVSTVQFSGIPVSNIDIDAEAIVISLKSRSCDKQVAIDQSLAALEFLKNNACSQFYFKYCSTFDSTSEGNIGPVTDALMQALSTDFTVICPALPINGRCVFNGFLFVNGMPLNESGMKDHPVTPMRDSSLVRLMDAQSQGPTVAISYKIIDIGATAIKEQYEEAKQKGAKYVVVDSFNEKQLSHIAVSCADFPLITGGSGLAYHLAKYLSHNKIKKTSPPLVPNVSPSVILSGSCSQMTNIQVRDYEQHTDTFAIDTETCLVDSNYPSRVADWVWQHQGKPLAPLVYATASADRLKKIQDKYGAETASKAVEVFFGELAAQLKEKGIKNFIVAGGETSGVVTQRLELQGMTIGKEIAPGVPWVFSLDKQYALALKSGNFGEPEFFRQAQEMIHD